MKLKTLAAQAALAALLAVCVSGAAFAQSDCKTLIQPSPFGPDDQTGATNRITPAVLRWDDPPEPLTVSHPAVRAAAGALGVEL